ncbi:MAG: hypothetical protein U0R50_15860 [Gaiellales bacterium]
MKLTTLRLLAMLVLAAGVTAVAMPPAAPAAVKPTVIKIVVKDGRPVGGIKRPSVKKGTLLRLVIVTNVGSEIHLHGYDIERRVVKGKPVVMQFRAKLAGRFELELHHPDSLLAQLTVR